MNLRDTLTAVKDKNLSKEQIEAFYDDLTHLYSAVCLELADLKKEEAIFFLDAKTANSDEADVSIKRRFRATTGGLRKIELETYKNIIPKELSSLKMRIYSLL